jgi:hypothetical protein
MLDVGMCTNAGIRHKRKETESYFKTFFWNISGEF